uniref:Uncharacterized protein n=1 Tax=viral metagenome TaxID=1070528 RepID=A0A6M3X5Y8_9ZZZZ
MSKITAVVAVLLLLGVTVGGTWIISYEQAYDIGYESGTVDGFDDGQQQGYNTGYNTGYATGEESGKKEGYKTGRSEGYEEGQTYGWLMGRSEGYTTGHQEGYEEGHRIGYDEGFDTGNETAYTIAYTKGIIEGAGRGYTLRDPTYREARTFISTDGTDRHKYIDDVYDCKHYSRDFIINAMKQGYHCFYVIIGFSDGAHALVAFNTTDRGMVYIEPQSDRFMKVKVGMVYWNRDIYRAPSWDDTVTKIVLIP